MAEKDKLTEMLGSYRRAKAQETGRKGLSMASGIGAALRGGSYFAARDAALQRLRAEDQPVGGRGGYTEKEKLQMKMDLRKLQAMMQEKAAKIRADMTKTLVEKEKELLQLKVAAVNGLAEIGKAELGPNERIKVAKMKARLEADALAGKAAGDIYTSTVGVPLADADIAGMMELDALTKRPGESRASAGTLQDRALAKAMQDEAWNGMIEDLQAHPAYAKSPLVALRSLFEEMDAGDFLNTALQVGETQGGETGEGFDPEAVRKWLTSGGPATDNPFSEAAATGANQNFVALVAQAWSQQQKINAAASADLMTAASQQETIDATKGVGVRKKIYDTFYGIIEDDTPVEDQLAKLEKGLGMPNLDDLEAMVDNLPSPEAPLTDAFSMKQRIMSSGRFQQEYAQQGTDLTQEQFFRKKTRELVAQGRERAIQKLTDQLNLGRIEAYRKKAAEPQSAREVRDAAAEAITVEPTPTQGRKQSE
jgi:hypothetical protein